MKKLKNIVRLTESGGVHIYTEKPNTLWIHLPEGGLLALDVYGPVPEVVVYRPRKIKIRAAGSPLESALLYGV